MRRNAFPSIMQRSGWEDEGIRDDPWLKSHHERDYESNYEYSASAITGGLDGMEKSGEKLRWKVGGDVELDNNKVGSRSGYNAETRYKFFFFSSSPPFSSKLLSITFPSIRFGSKEGGRRRGKLARVDFGISRCSR